MNVNEVENDRVTSPSRQTCKGLLLEHVSRMRRDAHALEALAVQIDHVEGEAEMILYRLLCQNLPR